MVKNKLAYFQGGGGVNEPTPGKKKYKSDPALVVQPRFKEPFYRNYDLYTVPGMEEIGPGTGYHGLQNYKSVAEFLKDRRERLKPRYVSDDSWQIDSGERVKNPNIKARAAILSRIIKVAKEHDCTETDENDGPNFDYGDGAYTAMSEGKKMKTITDAPHKSPGAFFAVDHENEELDKNLTDENDLGTGFYENLEHYKSVRDFMEHTPLGRDHGAKIKPEWERAKDVNNIDFPIDDMVNRQDQMIYPEIDEYNIRRMKGDKNQFPSEGSPLDPGELNISLTTPQISGEHTYLPDPDFEGKSDNGSQLNFGRDYVEDSESMAGRPNADINLAELEDKYLEPTETGLFGLPDGVDPEGHDADGLEQIEQPYDTISDISTEMYGDKWNI